jgi:myo-inositol-1(or 4)-monophosphatase
MEATGMLRNSDWLKILIQCKNNIQKQITPLIKSLDKLQQDLGIGAGGDPIKQIDLEAEKAIIETLKKYKVSFTLVSEESGIVKHGENPDENFVTVDPIDGTTNLTRGIFFYATSIAVSTKQTLNTVHTAMVADLFHNVTYTAQKGKGAYRNNHRIYPSKNMILEDAIIGIDLNP